MGSPERVRRGSRTNNANDWLKRVRQSQLPFGTKGVLAILRTYMNGDGTRCFPGLDELSRSCSLSRRQVSNHLRVALEEGWLLRDGAGGGRGRTYYFPAYPQGVALAGIGKQGAQYRAELGNGARGIGQSGTSNRAAGFPRGLSDPSSTSSVDDIPAEVREQLQLAMLASGDITDETPDDVRERRIRARHRRQMQDVS